jgi:pSer/pThr/pTyr-binding forkhead associated (FHA) protein
MQLVINRGIAKGKSIKVTRTRFLIGRDAECQLRPQSEKVSRRHAELKVVSGLVVIFDLGSSSGTRVNGELLTSPVALRTGDRIEIGPLSFTALLEEPRQPKEIRVFDQKKPAKRRRERTTEDEVASWLIDEDEPEHDAASLWTRQPVEIAQDESTRESGGSTLTATARRPSVATDHDAAALLRAMTIHSN